MNIQAVSKSIQYLALFVVIWFVVWLWAAGSFVATESAWWTHGLVGVVILALAALIPWLFHRVWLWVKVVNSVLAALWMGILVILMVG